MSPTESCDSWNEQGDKRGKHETLFAIKASLEMESLSGSEDDNLTMEIDNFLSDAPKAVSLKLLGGVPETLKRVTDN